MEVTEFIDTVTSFSNYAEKIASEDNEKSFILIAHDNVIGKGIASVHAKSLEKIADMLARFIVTSGPAYRRLPAVMEKRVQYILQQQHFNK